MFAIHSDINPAIVSRSNNERATLWEVGVLDGSTSKENIYDSDNLGSEGGVNLVCLGGNEFSVRRNLDLRGDSGPMDKARLQGFKAGRVLKQDKDKII